MNTGNGQKEKKAAQSARKKQKKKRKETIVEFLRERSGSVGSETSINKRKREEEERAEAEREFLGKFEKAKKLYRSPVKKEDTGACTEKDKKMEEEMKMLTKVMREIKEELRRTREELREEIKDLKEQWKRKEDRWEERIKAVEYKIENIVTGEDGALQEKIKKLEMREEIRERKEKRNNIVIKGWEVAQRDSLEKAVEEMIKRELHADVTVIEAFWTRRGTNMVTAKLKDKDQKRIVMIKKNNLKGKNIIIDNDLTWKERQIQREIRLIAETEKTGGAKVKIGYRKLRVNETNFAWKEGVGLKEQKFWSRQSSAGP